MGKPEEGVREIGEDQSAPDSTSCCFNYGLCKKSSCRWIVTIVLSLHLLLFVVLSIPLYGRSGKHALQASPNPLEAKIQASFRLRRPFSVINSSLPQLGSDLQGEVGVPNTQVTILSLQPLHSANWTEVVFGVVPEPSNASLSLADISLLRETFVELFLEHSVNLSLSTDVFGKAYHYEVLAFPGGVTVVPEQSGFPLQVVVLFNFTLHNTLSHVAHNFDKFKQQLAMGISLKANESLFVQLTNLNGSTLERPVIVQTSIMPVVGLLLPTSRLKQLAQEIVSSPGKNLGLNHTLFGRVRGIELSSYLEHTLKPKASSPAPSPSPSVSPVYPTLPSPPPENFKHPIPSPGYMPAPETLPWHHRHHHKHGAPMSHGLSLPHYHHHHDRPTLAPGLSPHFQPFPPFSSINPYIPASSPVHGHHSRPPLSFSPPVAAPHPGKLSPCPESPPSPSVGLTHPPLAFKGPAMSSSVPEPMPANGPAALQIPEGKEFVPAFSPSSSASVLSFPEWTLVTSLTVMVMFC